MTCKPSSAQVVAFVAKRFDHVLGADATIHTIAAKCADDPAFAERVNDRIIRFGHFHPEIREAFQRDVRLCGEADRAADELPGAEREIGELETLIDELRGDASLLPDFALRFVGAEREEAAQRGMNAQRRLTEAQTCLSTLAAKRTQLRAVIRDAKRAGLLIAEAEAVA